LFCFQRNYHWFSFLFCCKTQWCCDTECMMMCFFFF
jgi:hypothetical protein